jgi:mannose-6-phosphate isomerase-like protein (cupin superfamily)
MIKRSADMVNEVRARMRDGTGETEILHVFRQEEMKGKARLIAKVRLKKDCSIGFHVHENEEEVFYILKGQGVVSDGKQETAVGEGDATLTGNGDGHSIRNSGETPLEFIAVILLYK